MKLRKTDRRFNLYSEGFTCYLEFNHDDWNEYNRYLVECKRLLGNEFWKFNKWKTEGNWKGVHTHSSKRWRSKRIYLRGDKFYTILSLSISPKDENTFYL